MSFDSNLRLKLNISPLVSYDLSVEVLEDDHLFSKTLRSEGHGSYNNSMINKAWKAA